MSSTKESRRHRARTIPSSNVSTLVLMRELLSQKLNKKISACVLSTIVLYEASQGHRWPVGERLSQRELLQPERLSETIRSTHPMKLEPTIVESRSRRLRTVSLMKTNPSAGESKSRS